MKLKKLAVKMLSLAVAVMLLGIQTAFATWTHTEITTGTTYSDDNAEYSGASGSLGGAFDVKLTYPQTLKFTGNNISFKNNSTTAGGGAIFNESEETTVVYINKSATFENNSAVHGGAILNTKGDMQIGWLSVGSYPMLFKVNKAQKGGAIYNYSTIYISNSTFEDNEATIGAGVGGAIYNDGGTIKIAGATFKNNKSKGDGGAIYNDGTLNLEGNIEFTGNTANGKSNAIYNTSDGRINLWTYSDEKIVFNDNIAGYGNLSINSKDGGVYGTGTMILNADMSVFIGTTTFEGGTIQIGENGKWFGGDLVVAKTPTIDMTNGAIQNYNFKNLTITYKSNRLNLIVKADLKNEKMDTISATSFSGAGKITVNKVKIVKDNNANETTTLQFANDVLKNKVEFSGTVETLLYKYDASYDTATGKFTFVNTGEESGSGGGGDLPINTETASSAIAGSVGGYATQATISNQAFAGMNTAVSNKKSAKAKSNLYASTANQVFAESSSIERGLWLRPFAVQETIKLNNVDIDNTLYGTLAGIDFPVGQDKQISFYLGYAGSKQEFDEVKTTQTGYVVGLTGMIIKDSWYLGATVNGIFNKVSEQGDGETNDFDMNMFTVGAKAGYNIGMGSKWTLEPNITLMYGIANSAEYETSLGKIDSQSISNILVEPQVKAKLGLENGWQPYGLVGYAANLSGKPKVKAGGQELELDSIDGYVEYGLGVNKEFIGSVWSCYGQVTGRSGGRNGFGGNLGIKYKF